MRAGLYLEERIALARRIANEKTKRFEDQLPEEARSDFRDFACALISVLDGDAPRDQILAWLEVK